MNKRFALLTGGIVILIASALTYVALTPTPREAATSTDKTPVTQPVQTPQSSSPGAYKDYSAAAAKEVKGRKILFFHASWCPQCRALEADIKTHDIPQDVTIFKVDYDSSQELRQKYNVTLQTTLVLIDDAGQEVKKYVAYNEPTLEALKKNLLQ